MRWLAVVLVPPVVAFAAVAAFFSAEAFGLRPLSSEVVNTSEAAAVGAAAAALRFIADGANPNVPQEIRSGILGSLPRTVNAIDAAILGRRAEMIPFLRQHGASVTDPLRSRCLAEAVDLPEALPLLDLPPDDGPRPRAEDTEDAVEACLH